MIFKNFNLIDREDRAHFLYSCAGIIGNLSSTKEQINLLREGVSGNSDINSQYSKNNLKKAEDEIRTILKFFEELVIFLKE